jgi:DNA-binding transcriptional regulator GbsR (MarR family)
MKFMLSSSFVAATPSTSTGQLDSVQLELIDLCVRVAQFLGLPRSVGEIYGLLFISGEPLCLEQCIERLSISQGSASQGLKQLRQLKAVKPIYLSGDRRDFYTAETGLGTLVQGFLSNRILPGLDDLNTRLAALESRIAEGKHPQAAHLRSRLAKVKGWLKQGNATLGNLSRFLKASS